MHPRLKRAGFVEVGKWSLEKSRPICVLERERGTFNVLYAFVSGRKILYVGKTTIPLRDRMYQYQRPGKSQRTNLRVNESMARVLRDGSPIRVLALPDPGDMEYEGFHLNLAAGIESSIINQLKPEWNITGK